MVTRDELRILERYELLGETRYRICIKGTNIVINVSADSDEEALAKALEILAKIKLTDESIMKIRGMKDTASKC